MTLGSTIARRLGLFLCRQLKFFRIGEDLAGAARMTCVSVYRPWLSADEAVRLWMILIALGYVRGGIVTLGSTIARRL